MRYAKRWMRGVRLLRAGLKVQQTLLEAPATARKRGTPRAPLIVPGRFVAHRYRNRAGTRHYSVYAPSTIHAQPLPLLVMLHGCLQGPDELAAATRMNELAEDAGFVVVYPAQSSHANHARCWNWFEALHQRRDEGEPSLIAGITRRLLAQGLDKRRVYIAGMSAGGAMAAVLGAEYPDLYAAVGIHSGLAHGTANDLASAVEAMSGRRSGRHVHRGAPGTRRVPTIAFHGDEDVTVHPSNSDFVPEPGARVTAQRGERNGRPFTRTTQLDERNRPLVEHWIVHGGKHAWFGGRPGSAFSDPKGPDASREMLRFFLSHTLRQ